jgi:hypothetical protein
MSDMNLPGLLLHFRPKDIIVGVIGGLVIAAGAAAVFRVGPTVVTASQPLSISDIAKNAATPSGPLNAAPTLKEVLGLMLNSHLKWHTIVLDSITVMKDVGQPSQTYASELQLQQYGLVRLDANVESSGPSLVWVSDGNNIWEEDRTAGTYTESSMPADSRNLDTFRPPVLPANGEPFVIPYPLALLIPSGLGNFVFPHATAQSISNNGTLEVDGTDVIAGRDTVRVLWQITDSAGGLLKKHEYWIDARTGIVLKSAIFGTADGDWSKLNEQTIVTKINYDTDIPATTFAFTPAPGSRLVSPVVPQP